MPSRPDGRSYQTLSGANLTAEKSPFIEFIDKLGQRMAQLPIHGVLQAPNGSVDDVIDANFAIILKHMDMSATVISTSELENITFDFSAHDSASR